MNWMREQAAEGLQHATEAGEEITSLGGRVSTRDWRTCRYPPRIDRRHFARAHRSRAQGIELYQQLLRLSEGCGVSLEEFAREKIRQDEMHVAEIEKMLRRRGDA
jgi:bacterioferritin